jgi:hypothetical protein
MNRCRLSIVKLVPGNFVAFAAYVLAPKGEERCGRSPGLRKMPGTQN